MVSEKLDNELKKELEKIRFENNNPKEEDWIECPLIENKILKKNSKLKSEDAPRQYKIAIPKRIADGVGLSKKTHSVKMKLNKDTEGDPEILIEVVRK